jgi:hypothetical protein
MGDRDKVGNWDNVDPPLELPENMQEQFGKVAEDLTQDYKRIRNGEPLINIKPPKYGSKQWNQKLPETVDISAGIQSVILGNGDRGKEVKDLQASLNYLGYNAGTTDGVWGAKTTAAVLAYKSDNKLTGGAFVGNTTANFINNEVRNGDFGPLNTPNVRENSNKRGR